jgi:hypothetical protein
MAVRGGAPTGLLRQALHAAIGSMATDAPPGLDSKHESRYNGRAAHLRTIAVGGATERMPHLEDS